MKVVQINQVCYGSTGKLALGLSDFLTAQGVENYIYYTYGNSEHLCARKYSNNYQSHLDALITRIFGKYGFHSKKTTKRLIKELEQIKPDVVQLHNIHGHNVNLEMFFKYLGENDIKVVWTFHDCWAFTGGCVHFSDINCEKWKSRCDSCKVCRKYSWFYDSSKWVYNRKKELFIGFDNMVVVAPSKWIADLTKESFLKEKRIELIRNGINLNRFKPMPGEFKKKYNLIDKKILLGVAMVLGEEKGLSDFIELSKWIDEDTVIVLVGVDDEKKKTLPSNILAVDKCLSQEELAQIYSDADVLINCSRRDTFPTVNLEALACGTPIVTYPTGGSPETIIGNVGRVVEYGDYESFLRNVKEVVQDVSSVECRKCAEEHYDENNCYMKYLELYKELCI